MEKYLLAKKMIHYLVTKFDVKIKIEIKKGDYDYH